MFRNSLAINIFYYFRCYAFNTHFDPPFGLSFCFTHCRSDVEEGGEKVFPAAQGDFSSRPGWNNSSAYAKKGLHVKPKTGDALLFWSMKPNATLDPSSLRGGCPVIKGNKWSSTKWMHVEEYKI
ncbi:putative procollagen-proline 4-dioxygenase [Helianthus annuus]|nr:putative procollagen-proline 4-dioxygenase [Helianthus annuus]